MSKLMLMVSLLLSFSIPLSAQTTTGPQSNTIPTDLLAANFDVSPTPDGTQIVATVDLEEVLAINGVESETALVQSTNDVVTFTGGGTTITYDPSSQNGNVLPLVPSGTYTLTFTRFNGEKYSASVTLPPTATFSQPTENQVFQKTDVVNLAWAAVQSDLEIVVWESNCSTTTGNVVVNDAFTGAVVPAGFASSCTGAVSMDFGVMNANFGTGFGSFSGESEAGLDYSYAAGSTQPRFSHKALLRHVQEAHRAGLKKALFRL